MLRTLIALVLSLSAAAAPAPSASIEDVIDREMAASGVPGISYAVVTGGEISAVGARGVVRSGEDAPVTADTPFASGSISKGFTALAVMQLVEAGEVDLDAAVDDYLDVLADGPAGDITIRRLLSHTSGFSTTQGNSTHTDGAGGADELERRVDALADVVPAYAPEERWEYSNTNYEILGRVIEVVSGEQFGDYLTSHILEPIGMLHTFIADGELHPEMATGHRPWFGTKQPLGEYTTSVGTAPQGGVIASAADLALYMQTMLNGRDDVLSADGKAEMLRPASAASPFYGFGWFVDSGNGTVWHSGSTPGFESLATMVPSQDSAVVVLVNGASGMGFGETLQLRNAVTAAALGLPYEGEGSRWSQQLLFIGLVLLPIFYLGAIAWAWTHRAALRAKSGAFGAFSLWLPLVTTAVAAWVMVGLVPTFMGAPIGTVVLFQPDVGVVLIAGAVLGVAWAVFRLAVAYSGRARRSAAPAEGGPDENVPAHSPPRPADIVER